ncbi:MAG: GAF domain-containing protein [Candidatus Pacearchaeota archaeon]|nr:GAF domain-containing protein [Candidatus Pacearchaeota archaeon]
MAEEVIKRLVHTTKELRVLKSITRLVHSTDNLDVLITKLMRIINKELRVALIFLMLQRGDNIEIKSIPNIELPPAFKDILRVITEDTTKSASPIFLRQTRPNTRLRRFNIRSMISVPLMSYSGPLGAIVIMAQYRNFQLSTLKILTAIASQTASAIEHLLLKKTVEEKEKKITKRAKQSSTNTHHLT